MTLDNEFKNHIFKQFGKKLIRCFWGPYDCNKEAIRAHSIQNRRVIDVLARNGHVVMPQSKTDFEKGPQIFFEEIGRNKATTFTGLCSYHDNELFKPIDDKEIDLTNKEHLFLLSYRSLYREVHATAKVAIDVQSGYSKGIEIGKFNQNCKDPPMMFATEKLIAAHSVHMHKLYCDQIYLKKDWGQFEHKCYVLDIEKPIIAVSSFFSSGSYSKATKGVA